FKLHGEKLRGQWMLVRTGKDSRSEKDDRKWLLFKEKDEEAQPTSEGEVTTDEPLSAATGRTLEEIARDEDRVWNSQAKSHSRTKSTASPASRTTLASSQ